MAAFKIQATKPSQIIDNIKPWEAEGLKTTIEYSNQG
jgi:hypothetical protein